MPTSSSTTGRSSQVSRAHFGTLSRSCASDNPHNHLVVLLNTPGGSAEAVEKFVEIIRFHYRNVNFVVPDYAMSAGTILCMSGDRIFMDYSSSLGPIDPQVYNGKEWVPALGYLDKVEVMEEIAKSLGDNHFWHSHGRMISGKTLQSVVRLEIDDYSSNVELRGMIRAYNDLLTEFIAQRSFQVFMHSRNYF